MFLHGLCHFKCSIVLLDNLWLYHILFDYIRPIHTSYLYRGLIYMLLVMYFPSLAHGKFSQ